MRCLNCAQEIADAATLCEDCGSTAIESQRTIPAEAKPSSARPEAGPTVPPIDRRTQLSRQTWFWAGMRTVPVVGILSWVSCMLLPVLDLISIAVWVLLVLPVGGLVQWLFLRQRVPALKTKLGLWMLVTAPLGTLVLAAVVVPGIGLLAIFYTPGLPGGIGLYLLQQTMALAVVLGLGAACGGIPAAVLQAIFLRKAVSRAGLWVPPTVLGWALGAVGGVLLCAPVLSILLT